MVQVLDRYIGDNGDVLLPIGEDTYPKLVSVNGVYYIPQTREVVQIEAGNPIGLLLSLTYAGTP